MNAAKPVITTAVWGAVFAIRTVWLSWRLAAATVLVLATAAPAWATDESPEVATVAVPDPGAPRYQLGVGRLDGTVGLGDLRADDPSARAVAQAASPPATAGAAAAEPDGQGESASELNQ